MNLFNNNQKLSEGIGNSLIKAIFTAIDNNQKDSLSTLTDSVNSILYESFNSNLSTFKQLISIPTYSYTKNYNSINFDFDLDYFLHSTLNILRLQSVIQLKQSKTIKETKEINTYIYLTFVEICEIFYRIIGLNDFKTFEEFYKKYEIANPKFLSNPKYLDQSNTLDNSIEVKEYFQIKTHHRRVKFIVLSWLLFLYEKSKIEKEDVLKYIQLIAFKRIDSNELLEDLFFYNSHKSEIYSCARWDYIKREELTVYSPPQANNWLTFGFALFCLKHFNNPRINYKQFDSNQNVKWLPEQLEKHFFIIQEDFDNWSELIWSKNDTKPNKSDIERKIKEILAVFQKLKRNYEKQIQLSIISQSTSQEKLEQFKNDIFDNFNNNSSIKNIFELFKNITPKEKLENSEKETIGINTYFTNGKMMFVDENHQTIYGTGDWGAMIAREIDIRFTEKALSFKSESITQFKKLKIGLDESIKKISLKDLNANLIIIGSNLSYNNDEMYTDSDFKMPWQNNNKKESVYDIGYYKEIPIISVFSKNFEDKVLVCDFNKFVSAVEWCKETNYNKILEINIETISAIKANEIYDKDPSKWNLNKDKIKITKEEALHNIRLNVIVEIYYEILFEFKNLEAFEIFSM